MFHKVHSNSTAQSSLSQWVFHVSVISSPLKFCPHVSCCFSIPLHLCNFPPFLCVHLCPDGWSALVGSSHFTSISSTLPSLASFPCTLVAPTFCHGGTWGDHGRREGRGNTKQDKWDVLYYAASREARSVSDDGSSWSQLHQLSVTLGPPNTDFPCCPFIHLWPSTTVVLLCSNDRELGLNLAGYWSR